MLVVPVTGVPTAIFAGACPDIRQVRSRSHRAEHDWFIVDKVAGDAPPGGPASLDVSIVPERLRANLLAMAIDAAAFAVNLHPTQRRAGQHLRITAGSAPLVFYKRPLPVQLNQRGDDQT